MRLLGQSDESPPKGAQTLRQRIIEVRDLSTDDEAAWRDLARRAVEPNPFYEPDCVIPAARHQTYGEQIRLVVAEEDGRFMACLPFRPTYRWRLPYPIVTSQVRRMGYLGTPLVDESAGVEGVATLLDGLAQYRRVHRGRIFVLDTSRADGPVARLVRAAAASLQFDVVAVHAWERGLLSRREDASYQRIGSRKANYNLRRQRRLLSEYMGGAEVRLVDRSNDPQAVEHYIALEASGYKSQTGVAMAIVPGEPEYFRDMCNRYLAANRLHILALEVEGRSLAMQMWFRGGDGLFLAKISYDEEFASFGPGVLMQIDARAHFHDHTDAMWIDTCSSPNNETLLRLYPDRRRVETLFVMLGRSPIDRSVVNAFMAARSLRRRVLHIQPDS